MLQKIGNRTKTVLGFLLFVPIIGSFLLWGISDMLKAAGVTRYAATVGNTTISTQEFSQAYHRQLDGMRRQGMKMDAEMAHNLGIANQVLHSLIERDLLLDAAHDDGIVISDKTVAGEIQKEKAFYDENGKFSGEKFKTLLANAGIGETEFVTGLRDDMTIRLLLSAMQSSAVPPRDLPRALYVLEKSKYSAEVYTLPHNSMAVVHEPSEAELKTYYDAHKDHYMRPEMRRGVVAILSLKEWQANLKPSDDELKTMYEARKAEFTIPEERSVQFVNLPNEAAAKSVAEVARGGMKLTDAAGSITGAPVPAKTMENVKAGTLPADLDKAIFKLPRGETSEPVNTPLGWYVMQITNIKSGAVVPMARIHDQLVATWRQNQASQKLPKLLNQLDDGIAGGASLEELAKTYHLQLRELPMMDANGRGADANIAADKSLKEILAAEFKQNQGDVGNVFETTAGDYAMLRVDEVRTAAVPPLTDIHDVVATDWKKFNQRQMAEDAARKLANDWRKGNDIAGEAQKVGASLMVRSDLSRDNAQKTRQPVTGINRAILQAGSVDDIVTAADGNNEYIAKIRAIVPPAPASITDAVLGDARNMAAQWVKSDYVELFLGALEKRYAVEVNEKAIKQIESSAN